MPPRRSSSGLARSTQILPFLGTYRLTELYLHVIETFKEHKLDERARILAARNPSRRPRRTLSNALLLVHKQCAASDLNSLSNR
jgi:hypothetical protein